MPWNHPLMNMTRVKMATVAWRTGMVPRRMLVTPDSARPSGMNSRAFARSDRVAIMNLERP